MPARSTTLQPPQELLDLPLVGWIFKMFLTSGPITTSVIIFVDRPPDHAVPVALGPPDAGRRRASTGRRHRRRRRHPRALPERDPRRHLRRPRRSLADPRVQCLVPERDDRQPRVHRPGRRDLRPLDADRSVRWRAAVHGLGGARDRHPLEPAAGRPRRSSCRASRRATRACTTTSSARCPTC